MLKKNNLLKEGSTLSTRALIIHLWAQDRGKALLPCLHSTTASRRANVFSEILWMV